MKTFLSTLVTATAVLPAQYNPTVTPYGYACTSCFASFHEGFATGAAFDLSNTSYSMFPTASGYVVVPGPGVFIPYAGHSSLPPASDGEVVVLLSTPFPHPCEGLATALAIAVNGAVSLAPGNPVGPTPTADSMLAAPHTAWRCWRNMDTSVAGAVRLNDDGMTVCITWDSVPDEGSTSPADRNTFQFQFDCTTGVVHLVFESMSTGSLPTIVGYSPGGPSPLGNAIDLSTAWPMTLCCSDGDALRLDLIGLPRVGTTPMFKADNLDPTMAFGIVMFGLNPIVPGFDLANWGAPGCLLHVDWFDCVLLLPPATTQWNIPWWAFNPVMNYPGLHVYAQALTFDNALSVMRTSNALDMLIAP